jgi:hypothetical protein
MKAACSSGPWTRWSLLLTFQKNVWHHPGPNLRRSFLSQVSDFQVSDFTYSAKSHSNGAATD